MDIHVPESEQRWFRAVLILGTLVLALILVAQISVLLSFFSDILLVLLLGWLLAFILSPLIGLVQRALPQLPRPVVVGIVYVALLVVIGWIALVVAGSLASSIGNFISELPTLQARLPEIVAPLQNTLSSLGFQVDVLAAAREILAGLGNIGDKLVQPLTELALFSLGIVGNLFLVIFLSLFILLDQERIIAWFNRLVPPRYSETARLFESSVSTSFGGFIRGQAIQGVIMAAVATLAHLLFGLDFLPASAALSGAIQAIPFFGPFFSWIPPVLIALLTKPDVIIPTLIVMGVGWFIVGNIITPKVMANAVGLHPIVVLVSVIVGLKIAGIAGAIFALPFAAVIAAFFQHFLGRRANEPRDVTSRAAKRVGEREGRRVRVPTPPSIGIGAPDAPPQQATKPKPAEPTA
jgi:predicted PurR-regulated permease PerM